MKDFIILTIASIYQNGTMTDNDKIMLRIENIDSIVECLDYCIISLIDKGSLTFGTYNVIETIEQIAEKIKEAQR